MKFGSDMLYETKRTSNDKNIINTNHNVGHPVLLISDNGKYWQSEKSL